MAEQEKNYLDLEPTAAQIKKSIEEIVEKLTENVVENKDKIFTLKVDTGNIPQNFDGALTDDMLDKVKIRLQTVSAISPVEGKTGQMIVSDGRNWIRKSEFYTSIFTTGNAEEGDYTEVRFGPDLIYNPNIYGRPISRLVLSGNPLSLRDKESSSTIEQADAKTFKMVVADTARATFRDSAKATFKNNINFIADNDGLHFSNNNDWDDIRFTLSDGAKADITGTSQLYLHDDSKLHVDHDSTLFFHKGLVSLDGYGDGELSQTYDYKAHDRPEGRCTDNGPNLFFHDYAFLNMCNDATFEMKDNSYLNLAGNGWLDVNSSTIHLSNHSGIKLDNMAVLDLSTRSTLKMNYDGYPDGPAPAIICDPDGFTYISKGSYGNSNTDNEIYSGIESALFRTDPVGRDPQSMVPSNKDTSIQIQGETIVTIDSDQYSSTYIRISGDKNNTTTGDNPQACIILTGNIFQQMSGNSHMEMHDDSKLIMRGSNPYKEPDFYGNYPSPVEQGNNGPIVGLYSNPTITIGSINKNPKTVNYNVNVTIYDEDATSEITTYEDFSESGKQKIFNVISNPEITQINSCTIVSCTKNETNGYNVVLSCINYNIEPREQSLGTTTFSGTRTPFSYDCKNITGKPTSVLELTKDDINLIIEQLGFSTRISDIQITGGTIKSIKYYFKLVVLDIENLTYTCTINPYILHLPKKENNPYIEILNNSQIIMSGDAKVEADSNNLKFNDQCVAFNYVINSGQPTEETVTIESLYSSLQSALESIDQLNSLTSNSIYTREIVESYVLNTNYLPTTNREYRWTVGTIKSILFNNLTEENGLSDDYWALFVFRKDASTTFINDIILNEGIKILNPDLDISAYTILHLLFTYDGFNICCKVAGY